MKSFEGDPEGELLNQYYQDFKELKASGVDLELYELAGKKVGKVIEDRRRSIEENLEFNVRAHNATAHSAVTQLIVATSVGIALIANAVSEFHGRSSVLVSVGIAALIGSLLFGWLELNSDKSFHRKNIAFYQWAFGLLFSDKYKSFSDFDKKFRAHKAKVMPKDETSNTWFYGQAIMVFLGFLLIFAAMLDLWDVPSYVLKWLGL